MKRMIAFCLLLTLALGMVACGGKTEKNVDLDALYATFQETMPEMILLEDASLRLNLLGIQDSDCEQVITAICADGLRTDEVWLIKAKDAAALARIQELAENRLYAKGAESITYSPEQYAVVQKAETVTEGMYFFLLVSPAVEALKAAADAALN